MVPLQACEDELHTADAAPASCSSRSLMKLLFTGGMVVLVTMLDAFPAASPWVCQMLFRLTMIQQLPAQQVRLFLQASTHTLSLNWTPVYVGA